MKINLIVKVKIVLQNMHRLRMPNHILEAKFYFYNKKNHLFQKMFDCKSILISILSRKGIKKVQKNIKNFKISIDILSKIQYTKRVEGNGRIAQLGEHLPYKQEVIGSSPIAPTISFFMNINSLLYGLVVQLVRTLACHARGRQFEPDSGRHYASVAQSVEQGTENPRVIGSIPIGGTTYFAVSG